MIKHISWFLRFQFYCSVWVTHDNCRSHFILILTCKMHMDKTNTFIFIYSFFIFNLYVILQEEGGFLMGQYKTYI
jgi:hypothetical protein